MDLGRYNTPPRLSTPLLSCHIGLLFQAMAGSIPTRLPLMYTGSSYCREDVALVLPLCLSDSNFPLYVAEVEAQLSGLAHSHQ